MAVGKVITPGLPFSNVVASGIATAKITPGRTLEGILLELGGTTFAYSNITLIRVKANAKVIMEMTGAQAQALLNYDGLTFPATVLPIMFAAIEGRDLVDEMIGAFDTSQGVASITIEVTISGATSPTLAMHLIESAAQGSAASTVMKKVLRYPWNVSSGGQLPVDIPFGPNNGAIVKRLHVFYGVASNLTEAVVKENGVVVYDTLSSVAQAFNQLYKKSNQSNCFTIDFVPDDNMKNAMDTTQDKSLSLLLTFGAADSGYVVAEYLDTLGNL